MGRDKARRGGRRDRGGSGDSGGQSSSSAASGPERVHNQLTNATIFPGTPDEMARHGQDFLAGTVFAAGAGVAFPQGGGAPLFTVYLNDDDSTWGPAPQLRTLLGLVDRHGALKAHEMSTVATAWSALDHPEEPLVKLKLDIREPAEARGKVEIVLMAGNYRDVWQHIVGGGMIGLTTLERMQKATSRPGATFADGMEACVLLGIGSSSVLSTLMRHKQWPGA